MRVVVRQGFYCIMIQLLTAANYHSENFSIWPWRLKSQLTSHEIINPWGAKLNNYQVVFSSHCLLQ